MPVIFRRQVSLRTIIAGISLLFLLLPLGGIYLLRIYESALIRQTESELISQAAFVAALYKNKIRQKIHDHHQSFSGYGLPSTFTSNPNDTMTPIPARLDLAKNPIYPARPQPQATSDQPDTLSIEAGEAIIPVLKDAQKITLAGIKILDYQGLVVAGEDEHGLSFAHTEEFQQARKGLSVSMMRYRRMPKTIAPLSSFSRNTTINVFVALPVILDDRLIGVVWVNRTPTDLAQSLYSKRYEILWMVCALLAFSGIVALFASYTISKPIDALVQKARQITDENPAGLEPIGHPLIREIDELSKNFTIMAKTLQQRTDYIRNFAAHVSHEFKTPLTALQGGIELLQDNLDKMPSEKQHHFLSNLRQDCERLKQLVNRLLELARADMTEFFSGQIDILPTIQAIQEGFPDLQITVNPSLDSSARISSEALSAVLIQLLENSRQAGASQITIEISESDRAVSILVSDNGPGISEGNRSEVFTPFFTTKRTSGGTGLGLCIAKSLLERQGGSLTFQPEERGASFLIQLPRT